MGQEAFQRVLKLVALAADPRTPRHEAESAAMQACRRIQADRLLELTPSYVPPPRAELTVTIFDPLLVLSETGQAWRFARLNKTTRHTGSKHIFVLPSKVVRGITYLSDEDKKIYGAAGKVTRALVVTSEWVNYVDRW